MLRAHKDKLVDRHETVDGRELDITSYSVKVGNEVPDSAANLAFFSKPQLTTENAVNLSSPWNDVVVADNAHADVINNVFIAVKDSPINEIVDGNQTIEMKTFGPDLDYDDRPSWRTTGGKFFSYHGDLYYAAVQTEYFNDDAGGEVEIYKLIDGSMTQMTTSFPMAKSYIGFCVLNDELYFWLAESSEEATDAFRLYKLTGTAWTEVITENVPPRLNNYCPLHLVVCNNTFYFLQDSVSEEPYIFTYKLVANAWQQLDDVPGTADMDIYDDTFYAYNNEVYLAMLLLNTDGPSSTYIVIYRLVADAWIQISYFQLYDSFEYKATMAFGEDENTLYLAASIQAYLPPFVYKLVSGDWVKIDVPAIYPENAWVCGINFCLRKTSTGSEFFLGTAATREPYIVVFKLVSGAWIKLPFETELLIGGEDIFSMALYGDDIYMTTGGTPYIDSIIGTRQVYYMLPPTTAPAKAGYLTRIDGSDVWDNKIVSITDEYSISGTPLFYQQNLGIVTITNISTLSYYRKKYDGAPVRVNTVNDIIEDGYYLYTGNLITIGNASDSGAIVYALPSSEYKIKLKKLADENKYEATLYVKENYTEAGYVITYIGDDSFTVLLSPEQIYALHDDSVERENTFTIVPQGQEKYSIQIDSDSNKISFLERGAHAFRYRVYGNLKQQLDQSRSYTLNAGIVFFGDPGTNATAALRNVPAKVLATLQAKNRIYNVPDNIHIQNPNAPYSAPITSTSYWDVSLNMPIGDLLKYDLLILTGYGEVDLAMYASKLDAFLRNGGKLFIENLSNTEGLRFIPKLKTGTDYEEQITIADVSVSSSASPLNTTINLVDHDLLTSNYSITNTDLVTMRYYEDNVVVSVPFVFGSEETSSSWAKIIQYGTSSSAEPALMAKTYNISGTVLYSNMGLLRQIDETGLSDGAAKLLANLIVYCLSNQNVYTPWIYDHVLHSSVIFSGEYNVNGRVIYRNKNNAVERVLATTTRDALAPYIDPYLAKGTGEFKVVYQQYENGVWGTPSSITMTGTNDGSAELVVVDTVRAGSSITPSTYGLTESDVVPSSVAVTVYYDVTPVVYYYDTDQKRYTKEQGVPTHNKQTIQSVNGLNIVGYLSTVLPGRPTKKSWITTDNIFYELSGYAKIDDSVVVGGCNLALYNMATMQYYFSNEDIIRVPYDEAMRYLDNIVIVAWSDIYDIRAVNSQFVVKENRLTGKIYAQVPQELDQAECWYLDIHNGSFTGSTAYYTAEQIEQINKLNLPSYDALYYDINHLYENQAFSNTDGYKETVEEKAAFVNRNTVRVSNLPIKRQIYSINSERMTKVGLNQYAMRKIPTEVLEIWAVQHNGEYYSTMQVTDYLYDLKTGIVTITAEDSATVWYQASYKYSNLEVIRRGTGYQTVVRERLSHHLGLNQYKLNHANLIPAGNYAPVVYYYQKERIIIPQDQYTIDTIHGTIRFNDYDLNTENDKYPYAYIDYNYYTQSNLTIDESGINEDTGLIRLKEQIAFNDDIYVSYEYQNDFYSYRGYRNGSTFVDLDLNPTDGHYSYVPSINSGLAPTYQLLNKPIYVYLLPYKINNEVYTTECVRHCFSEEEYNVVTKMHPTAILLGVVTITNPFSVDDFTLLDTRSLGGGLKEDVDPDEIGLARYLWDVTPFDGMIYQANGVTVVRIPESVLSKNGGSFTEEEVEEIVYHNIPLGVYPIIEYTTSSGTTQTVDDGSNNTNLAALSATLKPTIMKSLNNTLGRNLNILFIGDSQTEGMGDTNSIPDRQRFVGWLQNWYQNKYKKKMGRGFIQAASYNWPDNKFLIENGSTYDETDIETKWIRGTNAGFDAGLAAASIFTQANGLTANFNFTSSGIAVHLPTITAEYAGSIEVIIDGASKGVFSVSNGATPDYTFESQIYEFKNLGYGKHLLTLKSVVTDEGQYAGYYGVMELPEDTGVWIHGLGVGGASASDWQLTGDPLNSLHVLTQLINYIGTIDLVYVMLGGNDIIGGTSKADYVTSMTNIFNFFKDKDIPVIMLAAGMFDESATSDGTTYPYADLNATLEEYVDAAVPVLEENDGAYISLYDLWGGGGYLWTQEKEDVLIASGEAMSDALHFNELGHHTIAETLAAKLPLSYLKLNEED